MQKPSLFIPADIQSQADAIMANARSRFGHGRFFMTVGGDPAPDPEPTPDPEPKADPEPEPTPDPTEKLDLSKLPTEVQELVKKYRKEAAEANGKAREDARTKAAEDATAAVTKKIAEALGLTKSETEGLTPEQLQKKLEESGKETAAAKEAARVKDVELAVYRTASKNGGDPDALLDSRSFLEKVAKLDPSKADFNDKVAAEIKEAVKNNQNLKASRAGASSADHGAGGSGENGKRTPVSLTDAVSGHYGS